MVNAALPSPRRNITESGVRARAAQVVTSSTLRLAAGDYTGGASEDIFTLSSHGLETGTVLHVLWQSAIGAATGGEGTKCYAKKLSSSTFQITDSAGTVIEQTADGNVAFLAGDVDTNLVTLGVIPNILAGTNDTTGGTVEDMMTVLGTGLHGAVDGDTIKLLYKSAAGVAGTLDATVYVKSPVISSTVSYFQTAATSGGAVVDTTADGTFVFFKTS